MTTKYIVNNATGQTINGETIQRPYKVYTALLTQSGGDNTQFITSGTVTAGVTYYIDGVGTSSDFSNVGGPSIGTGDVYFVATNSDFPNNWDNATLQYNTGAPVVTVLENTIGDIYFLYSGVGQYIVNLSVPIDYSKLYFQGGYFTEDGANFKATSFLPININSMLIISSLPVVEITSDDLLSNTPIEIRVYN